MAKMTWNELYDKFNSMEEFSECEIEDTCAENGWECDYCDSGIDDGLDYGEEDDESDMYLLYMSFDIKNGNEDYHVIFYYGDVTRELTNIEVREN